MFYSWFLTQYLAGYNSIVLLCFIFRRVMLLMCLDQTGKFGFTEFSNGIGRNCGMLCFYQMSTNIFLSDIHVANI